MSLFKSSLIDGLHFFSDLDTLKPFNDQIEPDLEFSASYTAYIVREYV